jgi:hypothetical protein
MPDAVADGTVKNDLSSIINAYGNNSALTQTNKGVKQPIILNDTLALSSAEDFADQIINSLNLKNLSKHGPYDDVEEKARRRKEQMRKKTLNQVSAASKSHGFKSSMSSNSQSGFAASNSLMSGQSQFGNSSVTVSASNQL